MLAINTYRDRHQAGRVLAQHLAHYLGRINVVVLALPRGGVPVGLEVAHFLNAPLDLFLVRKLGLPGNEEHAFGAIATGGVQLLDEQTIAQARLSNREVDEIARRELRELVHREQVYHGNRPLCDVTGRVVILADDGLATGFTMRAAVAALTSLRPAWITVAVPVGAPDTCDRIVGEVNELVCPLRPAPFEAVGLWYDHFDQTSDEEVKTSLAQAARPFGRQP
jgi:putative phosphoribosyl transferase